MLGKALQTAAAGSAAGGDVLGIEDVFSTWLYTGNGSTQTITNGIDLEGEGGLVWIKQRNDGQQHCLFDTERGSPQMLGTNVTSGQLLATNEFGSFLSDGFTVPVNTVYGRTNFSTNTYASWTFRKAEKFFDVVTYTGTSSAQSIAHNLGSVPGFVIVKRLDTASTWRCWHRSLPSADNVIHLNETGAYETNTAIWNGTAPTSTHFTVGTNSNTNTSGGTYVAYLFAHDAGGFSDGGTESVIKCGSYTGTGSDPVITLGWEPQWLLIKSSSATGSWMIYDVMRGMPVGGDESRLYPNLSNAEESLDNAIELTSTGFIPRSGATDTSGVDYIYIAIRRGPMKTPTDATEVFGVTAASNEPSSPSTLNSQSGVLADLIFHRPRRTANNSFRAASRLQGADKYLISTATNAESSAAGIFGGFWKFDNNEYAYIPNPGYYNNTTSGTPYVVNSFRRAPGFFDVVAYTGTGVARTVPHNLGVVPELIIHKRRDGTGDWRTDFVGGSIKGKINATDSFTSGLYFNGTISSTEIGTTLTGSGTNANGSTYIAYLFATLPGISKVGSYTGTGTTLQVDCGFASGARFVLIKRTDSTGSWYVWDTARGITSSSDPYLLLNSNAAEVTGTDYIDPYSAGFEISSSAPAEINASGGSFIFLAVA